MEKPSTGKPGELDISDVPVMKTHRISIIQRLALNFRREDGLTIMDAYINHGCMKLNNNEPWIILKVLKARAPGFWRGYRGDDDQKAALIGRVVKYTVFGLIGYGKPSLRKQEAVEVVTESGKVVNAQGSKKLDPSDLDNWPTLHGYLHPDQMAKIPR